jgi:AhpD family alkylhydroperoxidase
VARIQGRNLATKRLELGERANCGSDHGHELLLLLGASQMKGCSLCVDMPACDLKQARETSAFFALYPLG